ncbi:MAG: LysM peptidoglycan-binding domain-containing protein [Cyclobacteriaceae bacterium]|nr:LysM peptidoglycan-binding domain-containing protein [Cyclobacteriaceae bacterium]
MLRYVLSLCFQAAFLVAFGSGPRVPSNYEFAGIKLNIDEGARREIQQDVDALTRNPTYFDRKVEKIDLYFPIIERVFREENLPDDFKYLVIQESALIADAVSTSNAVGFWQFKEGSAKEVGLRVDRSIDERMHITAASRGAAKYLKKNNFFFDNWIYALLAYNTGPGGAEQHIDKKNLGKDKMEINRRTHWYVKKFLAHKIAFENEIHRNKPGALHLYEYDKTHNKSLSEIADYFELAHQDVAEYNKWLRKGRIPTDKTYLAIVPVGPNDLVAQNLIGEEYQVPQAKAHPKPKIVFENTYKPIAEFDFSESEAYPQISKGAIVRINGIPGFIASSSDIMSGIASKHGIALQKFLRYNDLTTFDQINPGQVYYLKSKKSKAKIHYHTVMPGETAWSISQKYGLKLNKLLAKNRLREEKALDPGMVIWLRFIRPSDQPVEYRKTAAQNVVVQSYSNELPSNAVKSPEAPKTQPRPPANSAYKPQKVLDDEEFLFEEMDLEELEFGKSGTGPSSNSTGQIKQASASSNGAAIYPSASDKPAGSIKKEAIYHIVKAGETLFAVSRTYNVSIGELRQWNELEDLNKLHVGQKIRIQKPAEVKSQERNLPLQDYKIHIVGPDDTLYGIARKYQTSIQELMELNDKEDFNVAEGDVLKIKTEQ